MPENAVFFDEVAGDTGSAGGSYELPHGIAMYERDGGSLWDRLDPTTLERDARFARELVVTWAAAIGNYTYGVEYVFKMNGAIDVNVNATGTTLNQGISSASQGNQNGTVRHAEDRGAGTPALLRLPDRLRRRRDVEPRGRAERSVDGFARRQRVEGAGDDARVGGIPRRELRPRCGAGGSRARRRRTRSASRRRTSSKAPTRACPTPARPIRRCCRRRSPSIPFWVTRYKDGELYAGGDYPFQGSAGDGLTAYASPAENVNATGRRRLVHGRATHIPHVEEYPVMTTESAHFHIAPDGFFDSNPALDAPNQ